MKIDNLRADDHDAWRDLWAGYQRFYVVTLPEATTATTWSRILEGRIGAFGARDSDDRLIGIVHYLFHDDTWSVQPTCYLQDLYVVPEARGTGAGRKLIEAVAEAAKGRGAGSTYWLTHETNATGRRLYDRLATNQGFLHYVYGR